MGDVDDAVYADARGVDVVGVHCAEGDYLLLDLDQGYAGGHGHYGVEVSLGEAELEVAEGVAAVGADEGVVGVQGVFEDVFFAVDDAMFLAFGDLGADAGGGVEGADACAGGADSFRQSSLGDKLSFDLAAVVEFFEVGGLGRMRGGGKGADDLSDTTGFDEGAEVDAVVEGAGAGMVGDGGEARCALSEEGCDEISGGTGPGEPGDHDGRAVGDVGDGFVEGIVDLVSHFEPRRDFRDCSLYGTKILPQKGGVRHG